MRTKAKRWYNEGALHDWELELDVAEVRAAFRAKGYLDVEVSLDPDLIVCAPHHRPDPSVRC